LTENRNIYNKTLLFIGLFLANFGALALGGFLMGGSPAQNDWYISLNKAPWTPPGWVFGFAWTFIMICFTIYMFQAVQIKKSLNLILTLFMVQWILNIAWNPLFFYLHWTAISLGCLSLLWLVIILFLVKNNVRSSIKLFLLPYAIWLTIAFSLNLYVVIKN
jgi:benzodiazapine receptor